MIAPVQWSLVTIAGQQLPPGITLSPAGLLSGTPTALGTFTFTVKATDTDGMAGVKAYTMMILQPTAAEVSVAGRVLTAQGNGLTNARVYLTSEAGNVRTALTGPFGYYRFDNVGVGEIYIVTVSSKRYQFSSRLLSLVDAVEDLDLTADQ